MIEILMYSFEQEKTEITDEKPIMSFSVPSVSSCYQIALRIYVSCLHA